jgi:ribosomal protein S18 acetylase RimI-like enzyme
MSETVLEAASDADYAAFGDLIAEYWQWLVDRYSDRPGLIDQIASHQSLDAELASLSTVYSPPAGRALLVVRDGAVVGAGAYRDLHDGTCEMKRVFVPERHQGRGSGRRLCEALVAAAAADGYRAMRLDTGVLNTEAVAMYESMGFARRSAYLEYPPGIAEHLIFMERQLGPADPLPAG